MKVKIIKECWFNDTHYVPKEEKQDIIIDLNSKTIPTWAEPIKLNKQEDNEKKQQNSSENKEENTPDVSSDIQKNTSLAENQEQNQLPIELNTKELEEELETLKTIGLDNNLMFDIPNDVSIQEQINFMKNKLNEFGIKV